MGWSYTRREKGISHFDWFSKQWSGGYELLDIAQVKGVLYGALKTPDGDVTAVVILIRWAPKEWYNFGEKGMTESMQPYYWDCPERILDRLTPTDDTYSLLWRAQCRHNLDLRKQRPRVKVGALVRFLEPLTFSNGMQGDRFRWVKGSQFHDENGYGRYRITNWRSRPYDVIYE
jgi:hypothetical protein